MNASPKCQGGDGPGADAGPDSVSLVTQPSGGEGEGDEAGATDYSSAISNDGSRSITNGSGSDRGRGTGTVGGERSGDLEALFSSLDVGCGADPGGETPSKEAPSRTSSLNFFPRPEPGGSPPSATALAAPPPTTAAAATAAVGSAGGSRAEEEDQDHWAGATPAGCGLDARLGERGGGAAGSHALAAAEWEATGSAASPRTPPHARRRSGSDADAWWRSERKHVFMLSGAGKPVYCLHGDEGALAGLMAVVQAMVSVVAEGGDALRSVRAGRHLFVFLQRGPFHLLAVSALGEAPGALARQAGLLYGQVLMILTSAFERAFERNARFDVRKLLGGTDTILTSLVRSFATDPAALVRAVPMLPLPPSVRALLAAALAEAAKAVGATYALLLAGPTLAAQAAPRGAALPPDDVLLAANFVRSAESFRQAAESFSPLCLPGLNPHAFYHAYIRYLDPGLQVALVLVSGESSCFDAASSCGDALLHRMGCQATLTAVQGALLHGGGRLRVSDLPAAAGGGRGGGIGGGGDGPQLLHFLYKHSGWGQFVSAAFEGPLLDLELQQEVVASYGRLRELLFDTRPGVQPHRVAFQALRRFTVLAQVSASHELYLTFDPLADKASASATAARVASWVTSQTATLFQPP